MNPGCVVTRRKKQNKWRGDLADPKTPHTLSDIFFVCFLFLFYTTDRYSLFTTPSPSVRDKDKPIQRREKKF